MARNTTVAPPGQRSTQQTVTENDGDMSSPSVGAHVGQKRQAEPEDANDDDDKWRKHPPEPQDDDDNNNNWHKRPTEPQDTDNQWKCPTKPQDNDNDNDKCHDDNSNPQDNHCT